MKARNRGRPRQTQAENQETKGAAKVINFSFV